MEIFRQASRELSLVGSDIGFRSDFCITELLLAPSGKTVINKVLVAVLGASIVTDDTSSDLSKIAKLNGGFRRNYGTLLGAFLYLRSISAARGRSWLWAGWVSLVCSAAMTWLGKHGLSWLVAG